MMDQIFTLMSEDPEMGPEAARRRRPAALRVRRLRPGREHPRARGGEEGNLHWEWTDDVDWKPKVKMKMSSETANKYFQGKENVAMAIARRRIKTGGDVKAALALIPITKPIYARYRDVVEEYPHLESDAYARLTGVLRGVDLRHPNQAIGREVRASPSQGVAFDERRRPRQRAALPAGGGATTAVPPLFHARGLTLADVARGSRSRRHAAPLGGGRDRAAAATASWTPAALAHARIVARLRARGHSLDEIREASRRPARLGFIEDLFPAALEPADARGGRARDRPRAGADRAHLERGRASRADSPSALTEDDLSCCATSPRPCAGFPLVAFLQLMRVYGQAIAQIADAEVRAVPPLRPRAADPRRPRPPRDRRGDVGPRRDLLPLAAPIMDYVHQRYLQHFLEQDVIGTWSSRSRPARSTSGALRVAIAFADLAGYTRLTEEAGDEEAVDVVERFIEAVGTTLPDDARVIKTIGDEVMVVGSDASALPTGPSASRRSTTERPLPRIGVHLGELTLYRDGDYYGRAVNLAARVGARAAGGEVLVTRPLVDAGGRHLEFERIGEVKLKGFSEPTELFLARGA